MKIAIGIHRLFPRGGLEDHALRIAAELSRRGLRPGLARVVQRRVATTAAAAWGHATGTDIRFPGAVGRTPTRVDRLLWRYQGRLMRTALDRPDVGREVIDVFTLSAPATRLLRPRIALATLRGPRRPAIDAPPFTAAERP